MSAPGDRDARPSVPAWLPHDVPATADVTETARRAGRAAWIEQTLFETLGGWVSVTPEPHVKQYFAVHCHRHAWHGELWRDRLPELQELPPERMSAHPGEAMAHFVASLVEPVASDATIERLVGVTRVLLPRCVATYTHQLHNTSRLTDAPTARVLDLVLADEIEEWRTGELLLQSLLTSPDDVRRAGEHQTRLESLLVEAGDVFGAVS